MTVGKITGVHTVGVPVTDQDRAIGFYVGTLGFTLVEDTYLPEQDKRWVVVEPPGSGGSEPVRAPAMQPRRRSALIRGTTK